MKFYESKVEQLRESDPKLWWKEVRRLSGAKSSCSSGLLAQLNVDELETLSTQEIADAINSALLGPLRPLEEYRLPSGIPKLTLEKDHTPKFPVVSKEEVYKKLSHLNPAKASGPDGIPNWAMQFERLFGNPCQPGRPSFIV